MFSYYLKLAFKSIKRNPILSLLMVTAIALGIGASMTTITVNYLMSADPIPQKSHQLFYVQVDSWDPHNAFSDDSDDNNPPPTQLTWTDATNLMSAKKANKQTAMAKSGGIIEPKGLDSKPFEASIRLTFADFFSMFDVPFLYGSGWDQQSDDKRDLVVVLSKNINDKVFGGENSIGKDFVMAGKNFRVVGVMNNWQPVPKFYDIQNGAFDEPEEVYMPFYLKEELELPNWGNTNCWKSPEGEGFKAFLRSECINFQMWVELPDLKAKADYLAFLDNYVAEQKSLGRFPRPLNNRLSDVMTWLDEQKVVEQDARLMLWLSFMFLLVCLLNTIGLLLAKFTGKAAEIGLRRAVGATKAELFKQHIIEAGCIGLLGGIAGLGLAVLGLQGIKSLYGDYVNNLSSLDGTMVVVALLLAVVSSVLAGVYPTWRACNIAPASQLKSQ
ncbi:ABC transporter permease [Paraglaciecola hydrolytica]|uniref:ABC transporter substrate-binding protein n=1 Tax=Paraglaciecola hydrolytica TaxID=1799789 RepID=A0A136A1G1_9ALTE|nr:ABC transporter permease [Paraglaciecola hydrolytica]KXI28990.1 ABC transporter substrate-binding protein [Paraglaciecola hydrolytica]